MSDRVEEYTGKKGLVKRRVVTVMDQSETGERLVQPIEYAMSEEEKAAYPNSLQDAICQLSVREYMAFGNKLRGRGKIAAIAKK